jgi:outer membrane protein OmpA-like peptidoglycan-associated protein
MASGNYAGISGAWLNPASIVDSRYKFDMAFFGYESYFTNNYLQISNRALARRLFSKPPYNSSHTDATNDLLTPLSDVEGKVNGATVSDWQFPFSFMANTGKGSAIALNIRNRTGISAAGIDQGTARMLFDNLQNTDLMGVQQDNSGFRFNYMNWMEIGFTYGRVLVKSDHHFLKGAASIKLLGGNSAIFMASDDLQLTFDSDTTISVQSPLIEYGRTERGDFDTYQRRNLLNGVEDFAMGWDIGLVYELRGNVAKQRFLDLDQVEKERKDLNKYVLRLGVSLLDAGKFTFERRELAQDHSVNISGWDIAQVNASDLDEFDQAYSEVVQYVPNGSSTFTYRLPTAIAANVDLHILGGFYLNAGTYKDATGLFKEASTTSAVQEWVAITPRFESRTIGLYIPVSQSDEQTRIGATLRVGPFYFGSNNLADLLANEQNTQADYHFGMRFSIGQGKPSALKRKYEALRKQQEGIGRNNTRLDSLEREVYALKQVVDDRSGRPTVTNNFFVNDSTSAAMLRDSTLEKTMTGEGNDDDREEARLKAENDYLLDELARASIQQRKDSAYIASLEKNDDKGRDKDRLKAERAGSNTAQKESNAAADQAKEMEKIRKQMRAQTVAMTTTAAATVAIAAKGDGDKKDENKKGDVEPAVFVNDSTIVLNGDTVPLIIPPSLDSARAAQNAQDTMLITVRDTVRITDTRVDTVRMQEMLRDTVRISEQAPGTIAMDEAERQRLMEPVFFATGKTTLGPQGTMKVAEIAAWLRNHEEVRVQVTGMADASGSLTVNEAVAQKRADSVRQGLITKGVDAARITTQRQLAPAGAAPDPKDRRAEVRFLP